MSYSSLLNEANQLSSRVSRLERPMSDTYQSMRLEANLLAARVSALEQHVTPPVGRQLLQQSDFTLDGFFEIDKHLAWADLQNFCTGLTHRYVNGKIEFFVLTRGYDAATGTTHKYDTLVAFAHPGLTKRVGANSKHDDFQRRWVGSMGHLWGPGSWSSADTRYGLWYQKSKHRLWSVQAWDYPGTQEAMWNTKGISYRKLSPNWAPPVEFKGPWGFAGIGDRGRYGGVREVPSWFQQKYGVGDLCAGFGGYSSLMNAGHGVSLGLNLYTFHDPSGGPQNIEVPFHTLSDHRSGSLQGDWYQHAAPGTADRGRRLPNRVNNYFDGVGVPPGKGFQENFPNGPFTSQYQQWFGTAPDGYARWAWGDTYLGTAVWFDGPKKHGFFAIMTGMGGNAGYVRSTFGATAPIVIEGHVFDPDHFGEVVEGKRKPHNVQPQNLWDMGGQWPRYDWRTYPSTSVGNYPYCADSATFDETTNKLYVLVPAAHQDGHARVFQYSVDLG